MRPHRRQPTRLPRPWDSPGKNTGVGCHFLLQCMKVKSESEVAQSCQTLSDPMDCSPPGSSVHGIFQARVLEWGAIAFSGLALDIPYYHTTGYTFPKQLPKKMFLFKKNTWIVFLHVTFQWNKIMKIYIFIGRLNAEPCWGIRGTKMNEMWPSH